MASPFKLFFLLLLFFSSGILFAQDPREIDSLLGTLPKAKEDSAQAWTLNRLCLDYLVSGENTKAETYGIQGLALSIKVNFKKGEASANSYLGRLYNQQGNSAKALPLFYRALKLDEQIGNKKGMARDYTGIGNTLMQNGDNAGARKNFEAVLKLQEEIKNVNGIATALSSIAVTLKREGNKLKDKVDSSGQLLSGKKYLEALILNKRAYELVKNLGDDLSSAVFLSDIATVQAELGERKDALKNFRAALLVFEKFSYQSGICVMKGGMGIIFVKQKKYAEAEKYLKEAAELSLKTRDKEHLFLFYDALSAIYSGTGKHKEAFDYYRKMISERDSLSNEENTKKSVQMQMQYDFDKKESLAKAEQEKKDLKAEEEKRKQKIVLWFTVSGLLVVAVLAVIILRSLILNKRKNNIISAQKKIVEMQKHIVEEKQKEILDSIYYARRIQRALITNEKYIEKNLNKLNKAESSGHR